MGTSYNEQLDALNSQFLSALDDFKKYYVFFYKNPQYQDYATALDNAKSTIQKINSNLFQITSQADTLLQKITNEVEVIGNKIDTEKQLREKLLKKFNQLKSSNTGSDTLIDDYKEIYKQQYITNAALLVGIFLLLKVIFSVYTQKNQVLAQPLGQV